MKASPQPTPPKWALRLLKFFCKPSLLEYIEGDLQEAFEENLGKYSASKAKWKYILEVLGHFRPPIIQRVNFSAIHLIPSPMLINYLKVGIRQIRKYTLFSALNIVGLAISLAVCLLVIMILMDQYSQDTFHSKKDRIFRIISDRGEGEMQMSDLDRFTATAPIPIAEELKGSFTGIEAVVRMKATWGVELITSKKILDAQGLYVDSVFFQVFDFGKPIGITQNFFKNPHSILLTQSLARKLFGDQDPLGEFIQLGDSDTTSYLVSGVLSDPPKRTHMSFEFLVPFSAVEVQSPQTLNDWGYLWGYYVYVLLEEGEEAVQHLHSALLDISIRRSMEDPYFVYKFEPQALLAINPKDGKVTGNEIGATFPASVLFFLSVLGIIVMASACFNYTNLSIARSLKRAKEIGVRKVIGGRRRELIFQFLIESVLISVLALFLAIFLLEFLIPKFYSLDPHLQKIFDLERSPSVYAVFLGFSIVVGIFAGIFPAFHLSRFQPVQVLKSLSQIKIFSFVGLRKGLLVVQFTLSLIFLMSTLLLIRQYKLFLATDHGFAYKQILNVNLQGQPFEIFVQKAKQISEIERISGSQLKLASGTSYSSKVYKINSRDSLNLHNNFVSPNFLENLDLSLVAGSNFTTADSRIDRTIIINEKTVNDLHLGTPLEAIGKPLKVAVSSDSLAQFTIIGVVKNFYDMDITNPIYPYSFRMDPAKLTYANIRIKESDSKEVLRKLNKVWKELDPSRPLSYAWHDEEVADRYSFLEAGSKIIGLVSFLAIIIACLGLLGMVTYMVEGKIKEVGIRKILGASEKELIWRLSRSFLVLLGIAVLLSLPITFFLNNLWLETFSFRVKLNAEILLLGLGSIGVLSLLMIISQTYKAAKGNPVDALRSE